MAHEPKHSVARRCARRSGLMWFLGALIAVSAVATGAQEVRAEKLVVFKNGKAMRARAVVEEGPWLKCEFEDGNYMSVPRRNVSAVEDATLLPAASSGAANQLVEGSRGAANFAPSRPAAVTPSVGARSFGRNARDTGNDQGQEDEEDSQRQAREEEAEALKNARPAAFGRRANPLTQPPIQGLQPLGQPIGQPANQASPTDQRRGISRKRDRGNATQLPDQDD